MEVSQKFLDMGEAAGMRPETVMNLADQFRRVYPDTWESLLTDRLAQSKEQRADRERIEGKQAKVRTLENQYKEKQSANLEKDLDKRIAELEKKLGKE